MSFKSFCTSITRPDIPDISEDNTVTITQANAIRNVSVDIKRKLNKLDIIDIPYINAAFEKMSNVFDSLKKHNMEDIPDGIMNAFANEIYAKSFNQLTQSERSIIATLSAYILI